MMKFTCGECGKRFSTTDEPAPGRVYRIPCKCGNTIILQMDERAEASPPPLPRAPNSPTPARPASPPQSPTVDPFPPAMDDPFLRAMMDAELVEPEAQRVTTPAAPIQLARRDPDYAERDEAPEPSDGYGTELLGTTRETRLAGARALLLDTSARVREILSAGLGRLLGRERLVAGGAMLGFVAFALGVWVGAGSADSRGKAAEAEARSRTAETSPSTVVALGSVAAPLAALAPVAITPQLAIAPQDVEPSWPAVREATQRRGTRDAERAAVRTARKRHARPKAIERVAAEGPTPPHDLTSVQDPTPAHDVAPAQEPARTGDGTGKAGETPKAPSSDRRDAEAPSEPTVTASASHAPDDARAETNPQPTAAEPADAVPGR